MEFKVLGSLSPSLFSAVNEKVSNLLDWYQQNKRDLPWRSQADLYKIWISEVMSQQTTLKVVVPKYLEFVDKLPDVSSLAQAEESLLRKLWSGMGYYARCRNLQKGARYILENYADGFPSSYADWLRVPGVGPYTASMVVSTGLGLPFAAVDGNITRVLSRLFHFGDKIWTVPGQSDLQKVAQALQPICAPGDFNQGLMELGATVCHKRAVPQCDSCSFGAVCSARKHRSWGEYPPQKPKKAYKNISLSVLILQNEGTDRYYLIQREKGFLKSTVGFPLYEGSLQAWFHKNSEKSAQASYFKHAFKHTITHHKISADVYFLKGDIHVWSLEEIGLGREGLYQVSDASQTLSTSLDKKALTASLQSLPLF